MPSMFDAWEQALMVARVAKLTPQSPRRWGKMTAHQMVWHLTAQLRGLLGELEIAPRGNALMHSALVKWLVIESPLPWPRGKLPTAPELIAFDLGAWTADVATLIQLLQRWSKRGEAGGASVHAAFGPLTGRQTGMLVWRHWDHHLKQFGAEPLKGSFARGARHAATVLAALAALAALAPRGACAADLLDQYCATDRLRDGAPRVVTPTPDGRDVLFLRSGPRDRTGDLWALDLKTGRERVVVTAQQLLAGATETLSVEEHARRERLRLTAAGIADFSLSSDGTRVLIPLSGRLFVLERASGAVRELSPGTQPSAEDARFSPDGRSIACVRDGDLYVIDVASGAERRLLVHDGEHVSVGSPEFVAQEELDRFAGYWWSPDSRTLLVQRTDESKVEQLAIADPAHPETPPQVYAYPRAGKANAEVSLRLVSASPSSGSWKYLYGLGEHYLGAIDWSHGTPLAEQLDREQHRLSIEAWDVATTRLHERLSERDTSFIDLHPGAPRSLTDGHHWLWIAERDDSGPWLELRDSSAVAARRLTPPGLRVEELLAVDEARHVAWVLASTDPCETHLWRVPLAGGACVRMGNDDGVESATFAARGSLHVRALRPRAGTPRWLVEDGDGRRLGEIRSAAETPVESPRVEWTVVGADSLHACLVRPRDFDPRRRYPVIDWAYGGPHSLQVTHAASAYVIPQWLADQGFVVVALDGRGTPGRGRAWGRAIRGDLIGPALADHVAGLRALCARFPELDPDHVGVMGWSFGGYFTVLALERAPQTYAAGVAIAPVVDWRDYDTAYTERYLGMPQVDSLAYARSSALTDAATLARPLLVIHGTADDNVYFFHSLKLATALNRAGRDWSFLPMPAQTHAIADPPSLHQVFVRAAAHLQRELGVPGDAAPPRR